jgi:hypothetical protein
VLNVVIMLLTVFTLLSASLPLGPLNVLLGELVEAPVAEHRQQVRANVALLTSLISVSRLGEKLRRAQVLAALRAESGLE